MEEKRYPSLKERVKALFIDNFIIIILMFISSYIFSLFEHIPDNYRIYAFILIIMYDPLFTSIFGSTIGQKMNGICVKRESDETKNIGLSIAIIRYFIKLILGWVSLLIVTSNFKHKAIHDMAVGSVVIYK